MPTWHPNIDYLPNTTLSQQKHQPDCRDTYSSICIREMIMSLHTLKPRLAPSSIIGCIHFIPTRPRINIAHIDGLKADMPDATKRYEDTQNDEGSWSHRLRCRVEKVEAARLKGSSQGKGEDKIKGDGDRRTRQDASWTAVPRGRERRGKESKAKSTRERRGERSSIRN